MIMIDNQFAPTIIVTDGTDSALRLQHGGIVVHRQAKIQTQSAVNSTGSNRLFVVGIIVSTALLKILGILVIGRFLVGKLFLSGVCIPRLIQRSHTLFPKS